MDVFPPRLFFSCAVRPKRADVGLASLLKDTDNTNRDSDQSQNDGYSYFARKESAPCSLQRTLCGQNVHNSTYDE